MTMLKILKIKMKNIAWANGRVIKYHLFLQLTADLFLNRLKLNLFFELNKACIKN